MSTLYLEETESRLQRFENVVISSLTESAKSAKVRTKVSRVLTATLGLAVAGIGAWNAVKPGNQLLSGISSAIGLFITYFNTQFNPATSRQYAVDLNQLIDDIEEFIARTRFRMRAEAEQLKNEAHAKAFFEEADKKAAELMERVRSITTKLIPAD